MVETAKSIWADGPTSTPHEPDKAQIRAWGSWLEESLAVTAQLLSASVARATKAELDSVVASYDNGDIGLVVLDDDNDLRGVYVREDGQWVKKADLPNEAAQISQAALVEFRSRYLGAFAVDPSADPFGNPLIEGALYLNSLSGKLRVFHSGSWQDQSVSLNDGDVTVPKFAWSAFDFIKAKTSATIKHVRDGSFIYDVITVKNASAKLVRQEFAPGVAPDGVVTRISCQQYAKATGSQIVINASGFRAPDGSSYETSPQARPMGLSIANNTLYQDWLPSETRTQAIVMGRDGKLVEANKGDGISGAQWVAAGAEWAACFGVICVRNGAAVNVDASYIGTAISARTVIGQKANGDILIVTVEGSTGVYGASGTQCGVIAQSLGCTIAYLCDGGGSTQAWWKDCYSIPTSDATERALPNFFVIDADMIGEYDTGWVSLPLEAGLSAQVASLPGLAFRQVNETIYLQVNVAAAATFTTTASVLHTNDFPSRFQPFIVGLARGFVSGPSGNAGSVFMGAKVSGKAQTGTLTYISGVVSWPAKYAGLPAQAA